MAPEYRQCKGSLKLPLPPPPRFCRNGESTGMEWNGETKNQSVLLSSVGSFALFPAGYGSLCATLSLVKLSLVGKLAIKSGNSQRQFTSSYP